MRFGLLAATLLLTACWSREDAADAPDTTVEAPSSPSRLAVPPTPDTDNGVGEGWNLRSTGDGLALALLPAKGNAEIFLFCPSRENRLLVNIPSFGPVSTEERLSFGSGGEAVALVADPRGDVQRGGVSGTGNVPDNLAMLLGDQVSASYGAQRSGPHPAPPQNLSRAFVAACNERLALIASAGKPPSGSTGACLMQGNERLPVTPLRAVGTEPFWATHMEGRCVNYSRPEDRDGTRVWTRYSKQPDGVTWTGALDGRPFELRTRAQPGCSDGMSDKRYPLAVELMVHGEQRRGCAEPI